MSKDNDPGSEVISRGELVMLRGHLESDGARDERWQTHGDPSFYAKVGFQPISQDVIAAPLEPSQPE